MKQQIQWRTQLYALLGDLSDKNRFIGARLVWREAHEHYYLEKLALDLNGQEGVPVFFLRPKTDDEPFPTLLYHHAHAGEYDIGKNELIDGRGGTSYGEEFARRGWAALCLDTWAFGERNPRSETDIFKLMCGVVQ
ncbi:MAG: hypothetical protein ABI210_13400 [Abditibacteriaceae bacterium]